MHTSFAEAVEQYLLPAPQTGGLSSKELVDRAITFRNPPRVPFSSMTPLSGDFCEYRVLEIVAGMFTQNKRVPGTVYYDEWGAGQKVTGREWDQSIDYPIKDLAALESYHFPTTTPEERYGWAVPHLKRGAEAGKYIIGRDPVMMVERLRFLLGFEDMMVAPYTHPAELRALVDRLTNMTIEAVEYWASLGFVHGFMTSQDWGLQTAMQVSLRTFRTFYKEHYLRVVEACHRHGLHFMWHNCGWIMEMIPEMIEIGVDVLQLDQPRLMGHRRLAEAFGGKIAFFNSVDIQLLAQPAEPLTDAAIEAEVAEMVQPFLPYRGGLLLRQYIAPHSLGITEHQNQVCHDAFLKHGGRQKA